MKRFWLTSGLLALVMVGLPPLSAQAAHTSLNCTVVMDLVLSPGLSNTPSKGEFASREPGRMECTGILRGHEISGPGSFSVVGQYGQSSDAGDTCVLEAGRGVYSLSLPTHGGTVSEKGPFAQILMPAHEGAASGISEDQENTKWTGTFEFSPKQGDCLSAPVTLATVTMQLEGQHSDEPAAAGLSAEGFR